MKTAPLAAALPALYNVPAPAKINWFLHLLGRRADGYHELQTVFQFIDWCDWLDFELRSDGRVTRSGGAGLPEQDLCVRAALALQRRAGCTLGAHIHLRKSIPAQAGLGGGSSDAATVLLALNRLWGLGLRRADLQDVGRELGADVPVFVFGRNAFAEGVGERLQAVDLPVWSMLVGWPGAGLATAQMFASELLTRNTPPSTIEGFREHVAASARQNRLGLDFGRNDMQRAAEHALPQMRQLGQWLQAQAREGFAAMSGSGSAMFVPCRPGTGSRMRNHQAWVVRECRALAAHPLRDWVQD